jgi:hypothetical protein
VAFQLDEDRAEQRLHVDVARIPGERRAATRLALGELAGADEANGLVEQGPRGGGGLHPFCQ